MSLDQNLSYLRQPQSVAPFVATYRDLIDRILFFASSGNTAQQLADFRFAIDEAYRWVTMAHRWRYYIKMLEMQTSQPQCTGTVAYTQSTRTLTLTGATWPSWAQYAGIQIGSDPGTFASYLVESVTDSTDLVLSLNANPGADIDSGTNYTMYRAIYTLPPDWRGQWNIENQQILWSGSYCEPQEWFRRITHLPVGSVPFLWTVMSDPVLIGSSAIYVWPWPAQAAPFGSMYLGGPRKLKISGYGPADYGGTISVSGAAVTGVGTSFGQQHVGSLLRVSSMATFPDQSVAYPDGAAGTNPYAEQDVIASVSSTTAATLASGFSGTYTTMPFCISDPVDAPEWMFEAILARARFNYIKNRPSTAASIQQYETLAMNALIQAQQNDSILLPGPSGPYYTNRLQRDVPVGGSQFDH